MQGFNTIVTQGRGIGTLVAYFELFHHSPPPKLPKRVRDWVNGAKYDAPHGFLTVGSDGHWEVTFALSSVAADIGRVPGLTIGIM